MKPETLKKIAEAMGYEVRPVKGMYDEELPPYVVKVYDSHACINGHIFYPTETPSQLVEVVEWLLKSGWEIGASRGRYFCRKTMNDAWVKYINNSFCEVTMQAAAKEVE